jgi:hypothetical protein
LIWEDLSTPAFSGCNNLLSTAKQQQRKIPRDVDGWDADDADDPYMARKAIYKQTSQYTCVTSSNHA